MSLDYCVSSLSCLWFIVSVVWYVSVLSCPMFVMPVVYRTSSLVCQWYVVSVVCCVSGLLRVVLFVCYFSGLFWCVIGLLCQ